MTRATLDLSMWPACFEGDTSEPGNWRNTEYNNFLVATFSVVTFTVYSLACNIPTHAFLSHLNKEVKYHDGANKYVYDPEKIISSAWEGWTLEKTKACNNLIAWESSFRFQGGYIGRMKRYIRLYNLAIPHEKLVLLMISRTVLSKNNREHNHCVLWMEYYLQIWIICLQTIQQHLWH